MIPFVLTRKFISDKYKTLKYIFQDTVSSIKESDLSDGFKTS